jgi:hypothetical protein
VKQPSRIPRWAQFLIGGVLLLIALAAGIVSLVLNVSHGLNVGLAAGITFGLADIGKIAIPIVAGIIGWSMQMRSTAIVCVLVSLFCATNYYADRHGRHLIEAQHGEAVYADKAKRISELEKSVADLNALVTAEASDRGCGPNCKALQARADEATLKLQDARKARSEAKPVEASGLAVMISMSAGTKVEGTARGLGAVNAVLFLALLEALVWLSVPAMRALNVAAATVAKTVSRQKSVATPKAKPAKAKKPTVRKSRKVEQKRKRTPAEKAAKQMAELKKLTTPASFKAPVRVTRKGKMDKRFKAARPANANEPVNA